MAIQSHCPGGPPDGIEFSLYESQNGKLVTGDGLVIEALPWKEWRRTVMNEPANDEVVNDAEDAEEGMELESVEMARITSTDEDFDATFNCIGENLASFDSLSCFSPLTAWG